MAGAIMEKVWGLFGMDPADDREDEELENYDIEDETEEIEDEEPEERKLWGRRNNKVVNMPQVQQVKMVISQPTNFEQAANICDLLKQKKSVIVNLEYVNKDVARRIIDVVSGAVHALDGHMQKISNSIVLIAPFNYDIENETARDEIKNKLSVSWLRNGN
ncbi:MAG: cell division protein SepF [Clostridia bacterium]|jgi:cell division inhibitor SepF|nr:cell division protein SepF [Clostridia bacterium]